MDFHKVNRKKLAKILIGAGIILLTFFFYLIPIRAAHFWDETVYLQNAETIFFGATNYNELSFRPPLLSIFYGLGFLIWHSAAFASIITAALAVLAPIFFFFIGKKLYGPKVGTVAALMIGFSPFIIQNANYLLTDVPVISFMAISFYLALFRERKGLLFLSGIFLSLSILMKFTAILLAPILLLYLIITKTKLKNILIFCSGGLLAMLPYLVWAQASFGNFLEPFIKGNSFVQGATQGLWFYFASLPVAFTPLALIGFILFIIYSIRGLAKRDFKFKKEELTFLAWIALIAAFLMYTPHKELRYILPISVPFILLASRGLFFIPEKMFKKNRARISRILTCTVIIFMIASALIYHAFFSGFNFIDNSKSADMIASNYLTKDLGFNGTIYFFVGDDWPVFAYYTGLKTELLPWGTPDSFYKGDYSILKKNSALIINNQTESDPKISWMNNSTQFKFMGNSNQYYFYEYSPN